MSDCLFYEVRLFLDARPVMSLIDCRIDRIPLGDQNGFGQTLWLAGGFAGRALRAISAGAIAGVYAGDATRK